MLKITEWGLNELRMMVGHKITEWALNNVTELLNCVTNFSQSNGKIDSVATFVLRIRISAPLVSPTRRQRKATKRANRKGCNTTQLFNSLIFVFKIEKPIQKFESTICTDDIAKYCLRDAVGKTRTDRVTSRASMLSIQHATREVDVYSHSCSRNWLRIEAKVNDILQLK